MTKQQKIQMKQDALLKYSELICNASELMYKLLQELAVLSQDTEA